MQMPSDLRTGTIQATAAILAVVLLTAAVFAGYYYSLTPHIPEDVPLDAVENGYCYDPKDPGLTARDWLGIRPEQSMDLFIRQFIDAYGVYHPSLSFYKGALQGDMGNMRRPERWEFIHACVVGEKKRTAASVTTVFYLDDGPSPPVVLGMETNSGVRRKRLSMHHLGWSSPQSRAFYELNPKYGRNTFYRTEPAPRAAPKKGILLE